MSDNITLPRGTVEQALEALEAVYGDSCDAIHALRFELAQQAEPKSCAWHQDGDSESDLYATSCRHYFSLNDGTPEDNKMHWCCYCGKRIVQELITEEDGND